MVTAIDLFSGCGGLSLGAARAGLNPTVAVELDPHAAAAHSKNFPNCLTAKLDLSAVKPTEVDSLYEGRPDIVFGGPPCQGFSYIGKRDQNDPRNQLLDRFFEFVSELKPRAFLMENVPGLLDPSSKRYLEQALEKLGTSYQVLDPVVLDASNFGAATKRRRVIVAGYDPSDVDEFTVDDLSSLKKPSVCVKDALAGLPEPNGEDVAYVSQEQGQYIDFINRMIDGVGDKRSIEAFESGEVTGFTATKHTFEVSKRFAATSQGSVEKVSRFHRLNASQPARTLRAGTGSDRGSFQSARPIHHLSNRVISVREAARIQGFPDWFTFHPTKWHSHRMIGNSVSPVFSEAVLSPIARALGVSSCLQS
jgi:DNA (cytosine-5)-methyltransferase 1